MTRISEIHGIGQDEFDQRGKNVAASGYLPYLSLTSGEMRLMLARQRAKIYADFYSDVPQYREAVTMIDNALNAGVSNGVNFVGTIHDDYLQQVAHIIASASRQTTPASKALFYRPGGIVRGIGAIIPYEDRRKACMEAAKKLPALKQAAAFAKCANQFKKEKIINDNLVNMSPHMLYKNLPKGGLTADVLDHRILHRLGVEGIAGVGKITDYPLVYEWVENGVLQKNAQGGVGVVGSIEASYGLSPNPEGAWQAYLAKYGNDKWRSGAGVSGARVGLAPLFVAALVTIIGGAISAAFTYLTEIRKTEILAMSEARGFGTPEFSADKNQWIPGEDEAGGLDTNTILMIAAGAGLLWWASEK